ncbi:hypothetical protein OIV83_005101 [Microbotryomycetes sp. JL201]|nr:hypothetical protein OIV83_005101 [Microbotryomycetes sp. JL201]
MADHGGYTSMSQAIQHASLAQYHAFAGVLYAVNVVGWAAYDVFGAAFVQHSPLHIEFLNSFHITLLEDGNFYFLSELSAENRDADPHATVSKLVWIGAQVLLRRQAEIALSGLAHQHQHLLAQAASLVKEYAGEPERELRGPRYPSGHPYLSFQKFEDETATRKSLTALIVILAVDAFGLESDFTNLLTAECDRLGIFKPTYDWNQVESLIPKIIRLTSDPFKYAQAILQPQTVRHALGHSQALDGLLTQRQLDRYGVAGLEAKRH